MLAEHLLRRGIEKVVVVGAGIGGLTFAKTASIIGINVVLVEKMSEYDWSYGESGIKSEITSSPLNDETLMLWPNALGCLRHLGIEDDIRPLVTPLSPGDFSIRTNKGGKLFSTKIEGKWPTSFLSEQFPLVCCTSLHSLPAIKRSDLHRILRQDFEKYKVENGHTLMVDTPFKRFTQPEQFSEQKMMVKTTVGSKEGEDIVLSSDLLVGADGTFSTSRRTIYSSFHDPVMHAARVVPNYRSTMYNGRINCTKESNLYNNLIKDGSCFQSWGNGLRFSVVPRQYPQIEWYAHIPEPYILHRLASEGKLINDDIEGNDTVERTTKELKRDLNIWFGDWHKPIPSIIAATEESDLTAFDVHHVGNLLTYANARTCLLGESCHTPLLEFGQGTSLVIEDALQLAKSLKNWNDGLHERFELVMREYESYRIPRAKAVNRLCTIMNVGGSLIGWAETLRNGLLSVLPSNIKNYILKKRIKLSQGEMHQSIPNLYSTNVSEARKQRLAAVSRDSTSVQKFEESRDIL